MKVLVASAIDIKFEGGILCCENCSAPSYSFSKIHTNGASEGAYCGLCGIGFLEVHIHSVSEYAPEGTIVKTRERTKKVFITYADNQ